MAIIQSNTVAEYFYTTEFNKGRASRHRGRNFTSLGIATVLSTDLVSGNIIYLCHVPSHGIPTRVSLSNSKLDTNVSATLAFSLGIYAARAFTSTTSGVNTVRAKDDVLDVDRFTLANDQFTGAASNQNFIISTYSPIANFGKRFWEHLGYDKDPRTEFLIAATLAASAATGANGTITLCCDYIE